MSGGRPPWDARRHPNQNARRGLLVCRSMTRAPGQERSARQAPPGRGTPKRAGCPEDHVRDAPALLDAKHADRSAGGQRRHQRIEVHRGGNRQSRPTQDRHRRRCGDRCRRAPGSGELPHDATGGKDRVRAESRIPRPSPAHLPRLPRRCSDRSAPSGRAPRRSRWRCCRRCSVALQRGSRRWRRRPIRSRCRRFRRDQDRSRGCRRGRLSAGSSDPGRRSRVASARSSRLRPGGSGRRGCSSSPHPVRWGR